MQVKVISAVRSLAEKNVFVYLLFCFLTLILLALMIQPGEGMVYPLDDTYIHIALSGNFAQHGVWGVTATRPAFCSSSPLWTLLLAGIYKVTGSCKITPFLLSAFFAGLSLRSFCHFLSSKSVSAGWRTMLACFFCVLVPLPAVAVLGMEHAMHIFFSVAFVISLDRHLSNPIGRRVDVRLFLWAFFATATRFESLFLIAPAVFLLLLRREVFTGFCLAASGFLPVALYGVFALTAGGFFLPNSLMFKGHFLSVLQVIKKIFLLHFSIGGYTCFVAAMIVGTLALAGLKSVSSGESSILLMLALSMIGHITFASIGSIGRYEAYLIAVCAVIAAPLASKIRISPFGWYKLSRFALLLFLLMPLGSRSASMMKWMVLGSRDVFCQQVQLVRLFRLLPSEARGLVAINDIGCFSCAPDLETMDLLGLGDQEVAKFRRHFGDGERINEELRSMLRNRGVKYAAIYDHWFPRNSTPRDMILVGRLNHPENLICANPAVMLYASDKEHADALRQAMAAIEDSLPAGVMVEYPQ